MIFLDFEKPIEDLYQKLNKLKELQAGGDINLDDKIADVDALISQKKEEVFSDVQTVSPNRLGCPQYQRASQGCERTPSSRQPLYVSLFVF